MLRGRRVIGYWAWELPVVPPDWRAGVPFVHEAWVLSRFTASAIEPLLPGRVRVVTPPVAVAPPEPSALDRAAFGLPDAAVVVLVSFSLASSFERKNPLQAVAAFRAAFGDARRPGAGAQDRQSRRFPGGFRAAARGGGRRAQYPAGDPHPAAGVTATR